MGSTLEGSLEEHQIQSREMRHVFTKHQASRLKARVMWDIGCELEALDREWAFPLDVDGWDEGGDGVLGCRTREDRGSEAGKGWLCPVRSKKERALGLSSQWFWSCFSLGGAPWGTCVQETLQPLPEQAASTVALLLAVSTLNFHKGLILYKGFRY